MVGSFGHRMRATQSRVLSALYRDLGIFFGIRGLFLYLLEYALASN